MVKDDNEKIVYIINNKLTNYLKSMPLFHSKPPITKCLSTQNKKVVYLQTKLTIDNIDYIEEDLLEKKNLDINNYIHKLLEKIPNEKKNIIIFNIKQFSDTYLKNFKETLPLDSFILDKMPYRQLSVNVNNKKFFINLSKETFYNLKRAIQKLKSNKVDFEVFTENLKRKEILTLLLLLSQS